MRTLIVSDLHLGNAARADVLRLPEMRLPLLDALRQADRLVLLGDVLELRDGPQGEALNIARPFFEELGQALAGREVVVVAGNHDHALVAPWLAGRRGRGLTLEQHLSSDASPMLAMLARWIGPARLSVCYPGLWLRDDVYATHGHYLDCHLGVTSGERLMLALRRRVALRKRSDPCSVDEYEAVTGPLYASLDGSVVLRQLAYSRWLARVGRRLARLSHEELLTAERAAMGKVAAALGLGDAFVVFGHTHRPGPFAADDGSIRAGQPTSRLVNCGCWLEHALPRGPASWQAPCVVVEDSGPPLALWLDGRLPAASERSQPAR